MQNLTSGHACSQKEAFHTNPLPTDLYVILAFISIELHKQTKADIKYNPIPYNMWLILTDLYLNGEDKWISHNICAIKLPITVFSSM